MQSTRCTCCSGSTRSAACGSQYVEYWNNLLHGDLGLSFSFFPAPVADVIRQSLPWTIALVGIATVISVRHRHVGRCLHRLATRVAVRTRSSRSPPSSPPSRTSGSGSSRSCSSPLPGRCSRRPAAMTAHSCPAGIGEFIGSAIYHGVLPALTIVISSVAGWILGMRNMMVTVSSEDYVTVAHAKGLSERRVMLGYAARNAVLPQISGLRAVPRLHRRRHPRDGDGVLLPGHRVTCSTRPLAARTTH